MKLKLTLLIIFLLSINLAEAKSKIWYGLPSVVQFEPVIDKSRVDIETYEKDLSDCKALAIPIERDMLTLLEHRDDLKVNNGAVYGSMMLGGTAGYIAARQGSSGQRGASILAGAIAAGLAAETIQKEMIRKGLSFAAVTEPKRILENCLIGRGYKILSTPNYNGMISWETEVDLSKCESNAHRFDKECL